MVSVRRSDKPPAEEPAARLPLRWAVIIAIAVVASVPAAATGGLAAAITVFFVVAGALHLMLGG